MTVTGSVVRAQAELGARLSAQERELQQLRRQLADKDKAIHLQQSQFDDAIRALATSPSRVSGQGRLTLYSTTRYPLCYVDIPFAI